MKRIIWLGFGFLVASVLAIYPLPASIALYRPWWLVIFLVWALIFTRYFYVGLAFLVGLGADLLLNTHLGHQAFCAVLMALGTRALLGMIKTPSLAKVYGVGAIMLGVFFTSLWILQLIAQTSVQAWALPTTLLAWGVIGFIHAKFDKAF